MTAQDPKRVALITGVTGQDGAYLAEYLLGLGYTVHGIKRRSSSFNTARVDHLYEDPHTGNVPFLLHYGDMTDSTNLIRLVQQIRPTEIYNLAAQSHVQVSFETPNTAPMPTPSAPCACSRRSAFSASRRACGFISDSFERKSPGHRKALEPVAGDGLILSDGGGAAGASSHRSCTPRACPI